MSDDNVVDLGKFKAVLGSASNRPTGDVLPQGEIVAGGPISITQEISGWVDGAIRTVAIGEAVRYHVDLMLVPGPNGNPQPAIMLLAAIDSPMIGQKLSSMTVCPSATPPRDYVEEATKSLVNSLLQQRRELLSQGN